MNHNASLSAPARRARRIVLIGLAVLGVASALLVLWRPLMMSAPMSWPGGGTAASTVPDGVVLVDPGSHCRGRDWWCGLWRAVGVPRAAHGVADVADGVIPDGVAVSVFDDETPAVGKLDPALLDALRRAATDAEADGVGLRVNSGWRSPEYQQRLFQDAVVEYGSQEEAARWVSTRGDVRPCVG